MTAAHPVITARYRGNLASGKAGLLSLLAALWAKMYDPANPASVKMIATLAGTFTVRGQAAAVTQARGYLAALTTQATGQPAAPYAIPAGVIGTSASGYSLPALTSLAPLIYAGRLNAGQDAGVAAGAAQSWLNGLAASEPYRAANVTVTTNATQDDRLTGLVERVTGGNACEFCQGIADQGYTPAHAGFEAHANCQCTAAPEVA
jgi:type II secretory pathway component PulM